MPGVPKLIKIADSTGPAGLYIHIPFCRRKCAYCDFYSITDFSFTADYLDALGKEMDLLADNRLLFDTLYIGGGTPSVLSPDRISRLIRRSRTCFQWAADTEVTMEINPGALDSGAMEEYVSAGVNRLSIGVQSFQDRFLKKLGRIHTARDGLRAIDLALGAGFRHLSLDLIYGIPGQDERLWRQDLSTAIDCGIDHLSCYMLTCEPGTPLDQDRALGRFVPVGDDTMADLYETAIEFLKHRGFEPYEVSSFARGNADGELSVSRHNVKYWTSCPYIGLGASAHSFRSGKRWWNHRNVSDYIADLRNGAFPIAGEEILDAGQRITEALYLGLRQYRGIHVDEFRSRFQMDFEKEFESLIRALEKEGYMYASGRRYALTMQGMLRLDGIAARFLESLKM